MSIGKSERDLAIGRLIDKARAIVTLHDDLIDEAGQASDPIAIAEGDAFERWDEAVEDLRLALEQLQQQ